MALDHLTLISGAEIPLHEAQVAIHQPTLKEIGYIGEEVFFQACQIFLSPKDIFNQEGKNDLEHISNFQVIMMLLQEVFQTNQEDSSPILQELALKILMLLSLLLPKHQVSLEQDHILLTSEENVGVLNEQAYEGLQDIVREAFGLNFAQKQQVEYKPVGTRAQEIAEKLKKAKEKKAEMEAKTRDESDKYILKKYISVLSIGLSVDINTILNYTVYQLFDNFNRFMKYEGYKMNLQARLAGATGLDDTENWMES